MITNVYRNFYRFSTGMLGMPTSRNDSVESVMVVRLVFDVSNAAIRFNQRILSFDDITISLFDLFLYITGMIVLNPVVETILWISLSKI